MNIIKTKLNSVALVRERTIPTERPPPVGEGSANFSRQRGVTWSAQRLPRPLISVFQTGAATFFYPSSSSIDLTRLSGPRSRPPTTQKIWQRRESNPGPLHLQPETLTTRPQRRSCLNKTYSKIWTSNPVCDVSYQEWFKEGDALLSLVFNFALEYAIRKIKDNHKLLKFNNTHQVVIYADDVNLGGKAYTS